MNKCKVCWTDISSNWWTKLYCSKECRSKREKDTKPFTNTTMLALSLMIENNPWMLSHSKDEDIKEEV